MIPRILGIDPGLDGALAVVDCGSAGDYRLISVDRTPTLTYTMRGRTRRDYDVPGMWRIITEAVRSADVHVVTVALELQGPRPKQSTTGMFATGVGYGLWRGIIGATGVPLERIAPQSWRRHHGLLGAGKRASVRRALERYPATYPPAFAKHDGAADAVLIADYAATLWRKIVPALAEDGRVLDSPS